MKDQPKEATVIAYSFGRRHQGGGFKFPDTHLTFQSYERLEKLKSITCSGEGEHREKMCIHEPV